MQAIKEISVSNGNPDIFAPLFLIILISAFKDLFEDIKRHRSDREENSKPVQVLDPQTGKLVIRQWKSLRVGEIVKVPKLLNHCVKPTRSKRTSISPLIYLF